MFTPQQTQPGLRQHRTKISIIGAGAVGMASAFAITSQGLTSELVLCDVNLKKLAGEVADLRHGQAASPGGSVTITSGGSTYEETAHSEILVICAGAKQKDKESRLALLSRNEQILSSIVERALPFSPRAIIIVASNPVDVCSYLAYRLTGLPPGRVIGTGTLLDSSRLRVLLAAKLGESFPREQAIAAASVQAYLVGEHGHSAVPVWSQASVGGQLLQGHDGVSRAELDVLAEQVKRCGYQVRMAKGCTCWGIGLCVAQIVRAVVRDEAKVMPVSTLVPRGYGGAECSGELMVEEQVYMSVPCVVGRDGVSALVNLTLGDQEKKDLQACARMLVGFQNNLKVVGGAKSNL